MINQKSQDNFQGFYQNLVERTFMKLTRSSHAINIVIDPKVPSGKWKARILSVATNDNMARMMTAESLLASNFRQDAPRCKSLEAP